mgnify:CR=1 FL=1|jgi:hypothetical protein
MNMIKMNKFLIILVLIAFSLIISGMIIYSSNDTSIKGIYFRKTYGYIGTGKSQQIMLDLTMFNVGNEDLSFFEDIENVSFDTDKVQIENIEIKSVNKERDIEILQFIVLIEMLVYDKIQIMKIKYEADDLIKSYDIGCINLENIDEEPELIGHGANSNFLYNNQYFLTINNTNTESFTINDLICSSEKITRIEKSFPTDYEKGKKLQIQMKIEFDVNYFDVFILKPILKFNKLNDPEDYYLLIAIQTRYEIPMTYIEIKEYINHD